MGVRVSLEGLRGVRVGGLVVSKVIKIRARDGGGPEKRHGAIHPNPQSDKREFGTNRGQCVLALHCSRAGGFVRNP